MDRVRRALGHSAPLTDAPIPPVIDEEITRLFVAGADLGGHFATMCEENKMHVTLAAAGDLVAKLAAYLQGEGVRRVALSDGGVIEKLGVVSGLRAAGLDARSWRDLSLDDIYDFDCGLTNVDYAVAETGTFVVRASPDHGRGLSLVPPIHVAIVEESNLLPDLIDLFAAMTRDGIGSGVSLITGPSKTSDIEMNLVVGVHGPLKVQVFLVS